MSDSAPRAPPAGVYVPVPTFFARKTSTCYNATHAPLDLPTQLAHSIHLARSGIRGLVLLGSTGEAIHLTHAERIALIGSQRRGLHDAGFIDYPLIAGTTSQDIEGTLVQLRAAGEAGAQWGLVLVPGYFAAASTQEGIIRWFTAIADQSPIPIMIYHYPAVSNSVQVAPSTFARLSQHSHIVGCKLSHGDLSHHAQIGASPHIDHSRFATFTGLGQQLLPILSLGLAGAIDGAAGFFPKCVVHLYRLSVKRQMSADEIRERRSLQYKLCAVEELVVRFGTVGIKEATSRILGMGDADGTRLPLFGGIPGGEAEWRNWEGVMADMTAIEENLGMMIDLEQVTSNK